MRTSIEQRSGRYRARYYDEGAGRWYGETFATKGAARDWLSGINTARNKGTWVSPDKGAITFAEWADKFWAMQVGYRPKTLALQQGQSHNHLVPFWGDKRLDQITVIGITQWAADLRSKPLAPQTRSHIYWLMHKMMRVAVENGLLQRLPFPDKAPLDEIEPKPARVLTTEEINALAAAASGYNLVILVLAYGGFRIGELCALRWDDVDFKHGTVRVDETQVDLGGHISYGPPKTKKAKRTVSLPWSIIERLAALKLEQKPKPRDWVFRSPQGEELRAANFSKRQFAKAVETAKLGPLSPHELRHTAVSTWISLGATPIQVAERAGHESVTTVMRVYGHLFPKDDDRLRTAMDAALAAPTAPQEPEGDTDGVVIPMRRRTQ